MVWMNFAHLFLGLHNSYINLSIFSIIFCHISMTACHMMSKMMIWAIGPMAYVPTKFHWDILKNEGILTTTTTTTSKIIIIIIIAKMKPHKNKIPFPFWGNGIIIGNMKPHKNKIPFPFWGNGIIIIAKMKPHKNKIPFPFWGNGITRGTVPRGTVDPIPNELSLWPRTMFRQVSPSHDHWRHLIHTYMYIYIHVDMYIYKWRVAHIYPIGGLSVLGTAMRDLILSLH